MEKKVITISREYGAGGRTVGYKVAEKLGIPLYDKDLVEKVAKESGFAEKFIEENGEFAPTGSLFSYAFAPQGVPGVMNGMSTADYLWNVQCDIILKLAEQGPCIIVGRNADYILKDREDVLHIYLTASKEDRVERTMEMHHETEKMAIERITQKDKRRKVNYQHYTGRTWGMAQNYDMCLDTTTLGKEECAQIIADAVLRSRK